MPFPYEKYETLAESLAVYYPKGQEFSGSFDH